MDAELYRQLVLQHKDRVHGYATWMLGDVEEARDVAQEALIRMWQHRDTVRSGAALGWLLKTTYRMCIDRTRRRKVRGEVHGDGVIDPMPDRGPSPERLAASDEVGRSIARALAGLGEVDRAAVLLREVQGMRYEEIAEALDLPLGTVKAKLHRTRERLRRELVAAGVTPWA